MDDLNNTVNHLDLTDTDRTLHLTVVEKNLSNVHDTFMEIYHVLCTK